MDNNCKGSRRQNDCMTELPPYGELHRRDVAGRHRDSQTATPPPGIPHTWTVWSSTYARGRGRVAVALPVPDSPFAGPDHATHRQGFSGVGHRHFPSAF